jgi:hypothetical protein
MATTKAREKAMGRAKADSNGIGVRYVFFLTAVLAMTSNAQAHDFKAGQLWSYQTRPGDEASLVLINLVESVPKLGNVYHVSVLRVHLPSWKDTSRPEIDLPHFPVLKVALDKSVVAHVGDRAPLDAYREGYATWRAASDDDGAGAFSVSIAEVVSLVEAAVEKNRPSQPANKPLERTRER